MEYEHLAALPMPLRWLVQSERWHAEGSSLELAAGARTDWFVDPSGEREPTLNAPALVGDAAGDYVLSARVGVRFDSTFDAGARGTSDDANGFVVDGNAVWLRVARRGAAFAFHASTDGRKWKLVRHFALGDNVEPAVGFEAQSPTGAGCDVTFDEIRFEARRLRDLRDLRDGS